MGVEDGNSQKGMGAAWKGDCGLRNVGWTTVKKRHTEEPREMQFWIANLEMNETGAGDSP
jgi:hypothetical protein